MHGNYSAARPAGREHVPAYPKGFIAIRIVQLVIAVVIIGLSAFGLSEIIITGSELSIFSVCLSLYLVKFPVPSHPAQRFANIVLCSRLLQR